MCTPKEAIAATVQRRPLSAFQPRFVICQFAYGRNQWADFHAAEPQSFLQGITIHGHFVSFAGLEIESAFDTVPRNRLLTTLDRPHADPPIPQFIENWLDGGRLRLRVITPDGQNLSGRRPISGDCPDGESRPPSSRSPRFDS